MRGSARYDVEFNVPGKIAATIGMIELATGSVLLATLPRLKLTLSIAMLFVLLGSIPSLCVVAVPRRIQVPLIAGLMILFIVTGERMDLLDGVSGEIAGHQAGEKGSALLVPMLAIGPSATVVHSASVNDPLPTTIRSGDGGWAADLKVATSPAGEDSDGARAIVREIFVDRTVEPNTVSFDWSVTAGADNKPCGSITMSVADRQAALDQVTSTVRMALDRSRATGMATCY